MKCSHGSASQRPQAVSQNCSLSAPDSPHRFNFLRYELKRPGTGAGHTENFVNLFCSVLEAAERKQGQSGGQDAYWQRTLKQLLRNAIDLAVLALDDIDLPSLYRIITSAPRSTDEAENPDWQKKSACFRHCWKWQTAKTTEKGRAKRFGTDAGLLAAGISKPRPGNPLRDRLHLHQHGRLFFARAAA
jgi:hypothetical protein